MSHIVNFRAAEIATLGRPVKNNPAYYDRVAPPEYDALNIPYVFGTDTPRDYQMQGIKDLREHRRWAIWDDPGLGKSLQAAYAAVRPVCVIAPRELCEQWANYWRRVLPQDRVALCAGDNMPTLERARKLAEPADVYIISREMTRYETTCNVNCEQSRQGKKCNHKKIGIRDYVKGTGKRMLRFVYPLPAVATLIIDEAHHFRGRNANMSKGCAEYAKQCHYVYELTATPIFKENDDLYMQLRIMYPLLFSDYMQFVDTWCDVDTSGFKTKIVGSKYAAQLARMLGRYGTRRTYADVGRELPKSINNEPIMIELTESERRRYDALVEDYTDLTVDGAVPVFAAGAVMAKLAQITANTAKYDALQARVEDIRYSLDGSDRGVVIFTWHREVAHKIAKMWPDAVDITGEISPDKRRTLALQSKLIVATMASLSEGVDLTHCHVVQFFECDYVPGRQFGQALKRVLRERVNNPTDDEPVIIDTYLCADTIDTIKYDSVTRRELSEEEIMAKVVIQTKERVAAN